MILPILVLIAFIILTVVIVKNNPLKKGKDIFSIYDNFFIYRLIGIIIAGIIGFIIYLFQKPNGG